MVFPMCYGEAFVSQSLWQSGLCSCNASAAETCCEVGIHAAKAADVAELWNSLALCDCLQNTFKEISVRNVRSNICTSCKMVSFILGTVLHFPHACSEKWPWSSLRTSGRLGNWYFWKSMEAIWDGKLFVTKHLLAGEDALYQAYWLASYLESTRNYASSVLPFNFQWWWCSFYCVSHCCGVFSLIHSSVLEAKPLKLLMARRRTMGCIFLEEPSDGYCSRLWVHTTRW